MVSGIVELSFPESHSINDLIPNLPFTVEYVSVDAFIMAKWPVAIEC